MTNRQRDRLLINIGIMAIEIAIICGNRDQYKKAFRATNIAKAAFIKRCPHLAAGLTKHNLKHG